MHNYNTLESLHGKLKNKIVTIRIDANVPIVDGVITDNSRIVEALPSIKFALENGAAKILLLSHFGRPKSEIPEPEFSLKQIQSEIEKLLEEEISFVEKISKNNINTSNRIVLFENLRYHKGEESGSEEFAKTLAELGDFYINDAFSCSHRAHASISVVAKFTTVYAGFLMCKEINAISHIVHKNAGKIFAIVGGSKISTKIPLLKNLINKTDYIFVAGGMANTFLYAKGFEVGASLCEKDFVETAVEILNEAEKNSCEIILPKDVVVCTKIEKGAISRTICNNQVLPDEIIADAGVDSVFEIIQTLEKSDLLVWNGPLGIFEVSPFQTSTFFLARAVADLTSKNQIKSIIGGGDTASAILEAGLKNQMSYVSTAGGAFLEWLEGKELPGIVAVTSNQ